MGFKHTWMATQESDEAAILSRLGFEIARETDDYYGASYTCARLPDGWLVIVSGEQPPFERLAPKAVPEGFVLTGFLNEIVMVSEVRGFRDGVQEWAVVHNPDIDRYGVQIEGVPPAVFPSIYQKLKARQAKETDQVDHIIDAPLELSTAICGFVHDYDMDVTWFALIDGGEEAPKERGKGFFARLFGR